jgi:4-hydroxy-4-methyl-2-oxoglutarate aldolase
VSDPSTCTLGLRIYRRIERSAPEDIERLAAGGSCDISDVARGAGTADGAIRAMYSPMGRIAGPAITVDLTPGDGMLLRAAIDVAQPGDVIVANAHGDVSRAILGGVVAMHMARRGVRGLIVDGAVRDVSEFRELGLPVMARGLTPRSGTTSAGWGEVNVPIACGGVVVHPGDAVIGDEEGLVVVPRRWVRLVADNLGNAGHPSFAPGTIRDRLASLPPDAPVLGIERVHAAVQTRKGVIHDATYDDHPGP